MFSRPTNLVRPDHPLAVGIDVFRSQVKPVNPPVFRYEQGVRQFASSRTELSLKHEAIPNFGRDRNTEPLSVSHSALRLPFNVPFDDLASVSDDGEDVRFTKGGHGASSLAAFKNERCIPIPKNSTLVLGHHRLTRHRKSGE